MPDLSRIPLPDLSGLKQPLRWLILFAGTLCLALVTGRLNLPAAVFLSAIVSGVLLALSGGGVKIPRNLFSFAQAVVGCMIARSISVSTLRDIIDGWPLFIVMVMSVTVVAMALGWLMARSECMPGSTAIWGVSPGGAMVMTLMSEEYGADSRLVAFMQYTRVLMVSLVATVVAGIWGEPVSAVQTAAAAASLNVPEFAKTMALAAGGAILGRVLRIPSGPMVTCLVLGPLFNLKGWVHIELPWPALWGAYFVVGWGIGLRFTRQIVVHALAALPRIVATMAAMIAICGMLAALLSSLTGIDALTAYLATSPGGMDSVAIIVSSTGGDMSIVMAMQTTRFIVLTVTGPTLATYIVRRAGYDNCGENKS